MLAYIHIGCEKTGTTSIQAFLDANAGTIRAAGWALPESGWFPNTTRLALSCMERGKSDPDTARLDRQDRKRGGGHWREDVWTAVGEELASDATPARCIVVSSEYFQAKLESEEEIALLKRRFEDVGASGFRIVVYLRRQVEYAISRYSTALRAGYSRRDILPEQLGDGNALFNYDTLLERWSAAFGAGAVDVRLYDHARLENGNVIDDFVRAIELPVDPASVLRPPRQNTGLPIAAQLAIRALNEALETKGVPRDESVKLRRDVIARLLERTEGGSLSPSRRQAIEFQSRFDASNGRVARKWFARERLFDDVFDYPDDEHERDTLEHVTSAFAHSIVDALEVRPGTGAR